MKGPGIKHRRIAPRLADGGRRDTVGAGLPPVVREWARMQADHAGISFRWWIEGLIVAEFARSDRRRRVGRLYRDRKGEE